MDEFEETEVTAEELCYAIDRSLDPLSEQLVEMLDGQEPDLDELSEAYLRWAAPVALMGRALIEQLRIERDDELSQIPGLTEIVLGTPEFDQAFQSLIDAPEDRELLVLACTSWMGVRGGCDQMLDHFAC